MNKQQEPRLRFNGFSGLWEEKYLDEVGDFSAGGDIKKEKLTPFGRYPVLANALTNNGIVGFYNDYEFESPAITITGRGDVGIAKARKENFSAVVRLLVLKNKPNYDVDFLEQAINKIDFHIESTGVPQLTVPQCRSYSIYLPSESEQTHLGLFFRRLDSQIAESRAVLEKSRQLKKAMLAKMFPTNGEKIPKIRFKGFEGEWECRKLGDLMNVTSVKRIHQSDWTNEGVRFLRARDIVAFNKGEKIEEPLFISKEKYNEYSELSGKVKIGDLLVTGVGTIGVPYLIEDEDPLYFKDGNVIWFQNENKIGGLFFYYSFLNNFIQDFIIETAGIGTVGTYTIDTGKKTPIFLPPTKSEQTAIGLFFRQLDETIALQSTEVEKLKQLKKGLLAAMLV